MPESASWPMPIRVDPSSSTPATSHRFKNHLLCGRRDQQRRCEAVRGARTPSKEGGRLSCAAGAIAEQEGYAILSRAYRVDREHLQHTKITESFAARLSDCLSRRQRVFEVQGKVHRATQRPKRVCFRPKIGSWRRGSCKSDKPRIDSSSVLLRPCPRPT